MSVERTPVHACASQHSRQLTRIVQMTAAGGNHFAAIEEPPPMLDTYRQLLFPLLKRLDPETAHERTLEALALAQANMFAALVAAASGGEIATTLHPFTTTGDKILDKPLQDAGAAAAGAVQQHEERGRTGRQARRDVQNPVALLAEPGRKLAKGAPLLVLTFGLIGTWARKRRSTRKPAEGAKS